MTNEIAVSVQCITYNHEPYIRDCLEGFVNQKTNFKFEVIIHDDASTDKTADIIREYEQKYPDIIKPIYQTENQYSKKVKFIRTYIWPKIRGKYIALCEGDDCWIDLEKLQKQYDFMEANPECVACIGGAKVKEYQEGANDYINFPTETSRYIPLEEAIEKGYTYSTATYFYRASLLSNNYFDGLNLSFGDYTKILNFCLNGKLYCFHEVFSMYRHGVPGSWTARNEGSAEKLVSVRDQNVRLFERLNEITENKYKAITDNIILGYDFNILLKQNKKSELRKPPYRKIYKSRYGFVPRTKLFLKTKFPFLLSIKKRLLK